MLCKNFVRVVGVAVALTCLGMVTTAQADVISVNWQGHRDYDGVVEDYPVTGNTGVVVAGNWNNLNQTASSASGLKDDFGATTGVGISWDKTNTYWNQIEMHQGPLDSQFKYLYNGRFDVNRGSLTFNVSNIPYSKYDLYLYYGNVAVYGSTPLMDVSVNGSANPTTVMIGNNYSSGFVENVGSGAPSNYIKFSDLSGASLAIATGSLVGGGGGASSLVVGLQIANVVPEPSSIMLLAASLIGLLAYAWRKRK